MSTLTATLALTAMLISTAASATRSTPLHEATDTVYSPGGQYTASLDQTHNQWRLPAAERTGPGNRHRHLRHRRHDSGRRLAAASTTPRVDPNCWRPR